MLYSAARELAGALSDERFGLHGAWTRDYQNAPLIGNFPHVDPEEYLTLSLSIGAPGTISFYTQDGVAYMYKSSEGDVVINSGLQREAITGVPSTVHMAPKGVFPLRRSVFGGCRSDAQWRCAPREAVAAREALVKSRLGR